MYSNIPITSLLISFSGTHGSGKTTIIEQLKQVEEFVDFHFIESPTRKAKSEGLEINNTEDNYDETQRYCAKYDTEQLRKFRRNHVIFDRCLFDTFIYTKYLFLQGQVSEELFDEIDSSWELCKDFYDIFVIPDYRDIQLNSDGDRIEDKSFQESIAKLFDEEIEKSSLLKSKVLYIKGSINDRLKQIFDKLNIKHEY